MMVSSVVVVVPVRLPIVLEAVEYDKPQPAKHTFQIVPLRSRARSKKLELEANPNNYSLYDKQFAWYCVTQKTTLGNCPGNATTLQTHRKELNNTQGQGCGLAYLV